jgi:hypothetical protein
MSLFRSALYTRWANHHFSAIVVAGVVTFCIVATCWRSPTLRKVTSSAAMFLGTMLAAMFADVFVQQPMGYIVIAAALTLFSRLVFGIERLAASPQETDGVLLANLTRPAGAERSQWRVVSGSIEASRDC